MLIQIILIAIIALMMARLIVQFRQKQITRGEFWLFLLIWLAAILIIAFPKIASFLANQLGVGRGADLAIYVSVILIFYFLFKLFSRLEKMEKDITALARATALKKEKKDE